MSAIYDLVSPSDPQGFQRDFHRDRAVGHEDPVLRTLIRGESGFELGGVRPWLGEPAPVAAPDHVSDGVDVTIVPHRPRREALGPDRRTAPDRQLGHGDRPPSMDDDPVHDVALTRVGAGA
jgi:hypothetical protein